jgi:hypothetical protein
MSIETMKQALGALEMYINMDTHDEAHILEVDIAPKAIIALRTAIAEAEKQEPVAWKNAAIRLGEELSSVGPDGYYNMTASQWLDWAMDQQPRGKNSLTPPPAAQRQPLTEEEVLNLWAGDVSRPVLGKNKVLAFARAIEAAHGITGEKPDAA